MIGYLEGVEEDAEADPAPFLQRLHAMAGQASRLNAALERAEREDESWWWRWILAPLRTK